MAILYQVEPIIIQQGTDQYDGWALRDPAGTTDNLTGWTATFEVFDAAGVSLYRWIAADNVVFTGLFNSLTGFGDYNIYYGLTRQRTSTMTPWGPGHFDIDLVDPFGHVQYRIQGAIMLERGSVHV